MTVYRRLTSRVYATRFWLTRQAVRPEAPHPKDRRDGACLVVALHVPDTV
jgi:hypothetical protein